MNNNNWKKRKDSSEKLLSLKKLESKLNKRRPNNSNERNEKQRDWLKRRDFRKKS